DNEIKHAMFDIGDKKALGPDGYTSTFFKKAWKIVGDDVCLAVKEFFGSGKLLGELNATLVSLVPKISTPKKSAFIQGRAIQDKIEMNLIGPPNALPRRMVGFKEGSVFLG
ncbi:hypothetical protein Tco_0944955, partial [Tanacetum coccineum]